MAIEDSDFYVDISAASDTNPFTDAAFVVAPAGLRILGGELKAISGMGGFYAANAAASNNVSAEFILSEELTSGDKIGLWVIDTSGNGYVLRLSFAQTRIREITAFSISGDSLTTDDLGSTAGDHFRFEVVGGTTLNAYKNTVLINSITIPADDYRAGFFSIFDDSNAIGATAIGLNWTDGDGPNLGFRIEVFDKDDAPIANGTDYTVVVRENINSTAVLFQTTEAAVVDGAIDVVTDAAGDAEDEIAVWVHKAGAEIEDDLNAFGFVTIIDFDEE
jgi:hypothetical protein